MQHATRIDTGTRSHATTYTEAPTGIHTYTRRCTYCGKRPAGNRGGSNGDELPRRVPSNASQGARRTVTKTVGQQACQPEGRRITRVCAKRSAAIGVVSLSTRAPLIRWERRLQIRSTTTHWNKHSLKPTSSHCSVGPCVCRNAEKSAGLSTLFQTPFKTTVSKRHPLSHSARRHPRPALGAAETHRSRKLGAPRTSCRLSTDESHNNSCPVLQGREHWLATVGLPPRLVMQHDSTRPYSHAKRTPMALTQTQTPTIWRSTACSLVAFNS